MPILYREPYRAQFFDHVPSDGVTVPVRDYDSYVMFPEYRWAYNKLNIAEKQGLLCGPHGVPPPHYPIFSKPIYNLNTMGVGTRLLIDEDDYLENRTAGHMWCEYLTGDHLSTDIAVCRGRVVWMSTTRGHALKGGTFDYWDVNVPVSDSDRAYLVHFVEKHFGTYSGMINAETIGGHIIEAHLRFADQWTDLYPAGFVKALVWLYSNSSDPWRPDKEMQANTVKGYSVILFKPHGRRMWSKPCDERVQQILEKYQLSSIQLPFAADQPTHRASMPPGGFRVACLNGRDLEDCFKARKELDELFDEANPPEEVGMACGK